MDSATNVAPASPVAPAAGGAPDNAQLQRIGSEVWQSLVGQQPSTGASDGGRVLATIQLTGSWNGTVKLECDGQLAREVASAMFELDPEQLADDEVHDALGELANTVGGLVKAELPTGCTLSLPTVISGHDVHVSLPRSHSVASCQVAESAERLQLSLHLADD